MKNRGVNILVALLVLVLCLVLFAKVDRETITGYQVQTPSVGTTTVTWNGAYTTNTPATMTTNDNPLNGNPDCGGVPCYGTGPIYAMDGASAFCYDITGGGQESLIYKNGDRMGLITSLTNNNEYFYIDGRGNDAYRGTNSFLIRVNHDPQDTDNFIAIKTGHPTPCPGTCPSYVSHTRLDVYAITSFGPYTAGQKIASLPISPSDNLANARFLTTSDVVLDVGETIKIVAASHIIQTLSAFALSVSPTGTISFTHTDYLNDPYCPPGCSTDCSGGNFGNSAYHAKICLQNTDGSCSGQYRDVYFSSDFDMIDTNGQFVHLGSWTDFNGQNVPIAQTGSYGPYSINIQSNCLGGSPNGIDGQIVWNRGTEAQPDYYVASMHDNGVSGAAHGVALIAKFSISTAGVMTFTPLKVTIGSDSQSIAVSYIKGYSDPVILNGRYAFDAVTGQIVGDAGFTTGDGPVFWYTNAVNNGAYGLGNQYGFEVKQTAPTLYHVLPTVSGVQNSGTPFYNVGVSGLSTPYPLGTVLNNPSQGGGATYGMCADYDPAANTITFKYVDVVNQKSASVLQSFDQGPVISDVNQQKKDFALKYVQQTQIPGLRGYDGVNLIHELNSLSPTSCTNGATQSCSTGQPGICATGTQTCSGGAWGTCVAPTPQAEICSDNLDNDCDGIINNGCLPNQPNNLQAIIN